MEISIIIAIILLAIIYVWDNDETNDNRKQISSWLLIIISIILTSLIIECCNSNIPTAVDVYNHKTILDITYRNRTPIDTIVVFKPEFIN